MTTQSQEEQRQVTATDAAVLLLIEQQRQEQLALSTAVMAAFVALWAEFQRGITSGRLAPWFDAVAAVTESYGEASWQMARRHYVDLRTLQGVPGPRPAFRPIRTDVAQLWSDLRAYVVKPYLDRLGQGQPPEEAETGLQSRGAGASQKHALAPGRALVQQAVDKAAAERGAELPPGVPPARPGEVDRQLVGWVRTTDGDPCYFCAMLASRGAVYASHDSAIFRADGSKWHPRCGCLAYPVWTDNPTLPEINYELEMLWREAQENPPPGERLDQQKPRTEGGSPDVAGRRARNNFRRLLAERSRRMRRAEGLPDDTP